MTAKGARVAFSVLGVCWGEDESGPDVRRVAAAAAEIAGSGAYGLRGWRNIGFKK